MKLSTIGLTMLAIIMIPLAAFAQATVAVPVTEVPVWGDFLTPIFTIIASAAATVLTAILVKVLKGVGINLDQQTQAVVDGALERSIGFGLQKVSEATVGNRDIDVENQTIENAVLYFHKNWPDTVKKLGLTDDKIRDMVRSRLGTGYLLEDLEEK